MALRDAGGAKWTRDKKRENDKLTVVLAYDNPDGGRLAAKRAETSYPTRETQDFFVVKMNGQAFDQRFDNKTEAKKFLRDYIKGNDLTRY